MDDLSFANPEMSWLALPVVLLGAWGAVQLSNLDKRLQRLGRGPVIGRLVASFSPRFEGWRLFCLVLAMLLLVGASTRPRYGLRETEVSNAGIDIAFAVDASKSMLVKDVAPSRLKGTMLEISALLDKLAGGRVALVPFAGIPFVQTPLTTDHDVLRTYLAELRPQDMPIGGTNIGRAIKTAVEVLTGSDERAKAQLKGNLVTQFAGSKHKAIVLFSDGEDHDGAALDEAKNAAKKGIRIFTVGVGSSFGDPVPIVDNDGLQTGTLKDPNGNPIFSKLNIDVLKSVASATGGRFLHYANKSIATELFAALDALEKAEHKERFKLLGEDRFQYLLGPALLLLFAALFIPRRRRDGVMSGAREDRKKAAKSGKSGKSRLFRRKLAASMALFLLPTLAAGHARAETPPDAPAKVAPAAADRKAQAAVPNKARTQADARRDPRWTERENPDISDGRSLLKEGKSGQALASFKAAQSSRPEHAVIWYNMALAQAALSMWEESDKSFKRALAALDEHDPQLEADLHFGAGTMQLQWGLSIRQQARDEAQVNAKQPGQPGGNQPAPDPAPGGAAGNAQPGAAQPNAQGNAQSNAQKAESDALKHFREAVASLQLAILADPTRPEIARNLEIARLYAYPPCRSRDTNHEPNDQAELAKRLELDPKKKETTFALRSCPADNDFFKLKLHPGDRLTASIETRAEEAVVIDPLDQETGREPELGIALLPADGKRHIRGAPPPAKPLQTVDLNRVIDEEDVLIAVRNVAEVEASYDLKLKLLPACSRIEDRAEPNDVPSQARQLPQGKPVALRLCPRNDDYFGVPLQIGQGLLIEAEATFDMGAEEFELDVLGPTGKVLARAVKGDKGYRARLAAAPVPGNYLVRVRGGLDTEADYKLAAQVLPPCAARDDAWEDNDQPLSANPLLSEMLKQPLDGLQLCPGDDDWFAVELKEGESLFADLAASVEGLPDVAPLAGALTMTVYDSQGRIWRRARGPQLAQGAKSLNRVAAVLSPPPGKYYVRITGGGVAEPEFPVPELPEGAKVVEGTAPPPGAGQQLPMMQPGQGQLPPGVRLPPGMQPPGQRQPPSIQPPSMQPPSMQPPSMQPPGPSQPGAPQPGIRAVPLPPGQAPHGMQPGQLPPGAAVPPQGRGQEQAKGRKIRKILLPPGFPPPSYDPVKALLDLPYSLKLRILPPCPDGNDELEPNNEPGASKEMKVKQERLLRICKGDVDWLHVAQKAGQQLQVMARYDLAHGPIAIKVHDEGGSTVLAEGKVAAPRLPGRPAGDDDTPQARRGRTATTGVGIPAPEKDRVVKLRVAAKLPDAENFYVLRVQEPPPPSNKRNNKNKDDKDKKDNKDKKDKKKDQDKKKQDKKGKDKQKKPQDKEQKRQKRLRQQMKRHDRNPRNLEAQEALRRSPFRNTRPEKDW